MMNSIKRLVLTGAAVMLMLSFAAPAMAADLTDYIDPNATYTDYGSSFDPSVYDSWSWSIPDIGTAGDQIPVEAGGPARTPTGPVEVGPAPQSTCQWVWTGDHWEQWRDAGDGTGNLIPC
jgi:hypothetical protein